MSIFRKLSLFFRDETPPVQLAADLIFEGASDDLLQKTKSFINMRPLMKHHFSRAMVVPTHCIIGTDHVDYQHHYDPQETGTILWKPCQYKSFPGKRGHPGEGFKTGWFPQSLKSPLYNIIEVERHPSLELYIVGNGNHRVMASKLETESPGFVYANVSFNRWSEDALFMFYMLSFRFYWHRFSFHNGSLVFIEIRHSFSSRVVCFSKREARQNSDFYKKLPSLLAFSIRRPFSRWLMPTFENWLKSISAIMTDAQYHDFHSYKP